MNDKNKVFIMLTGFGVGCYWVGLAIGHMIGRHENAEIEAIDESVIKMDRAVIESLHKQNEKIVDENKKISKENAKLKMKLKK